MEGFSTAMEWVRGFQGNGRVSRCRGTEELSNQGRGDGVGRNIVQKRRESGLEIGEEG